MLWDFFAPLFTTFSVVSFSGATIASLIAVYVPGLRRWAITVAAGFLLVYFVHIHGDNQGAARKQAEWDEANRTAAIAYAERDAENFNKTKALADGFEAQIAQERAERERIKRDLLRKIGTGNSRLTRDDLEWLRDYDRHAAPRR